jgi:LysR family transcriptional activator of nhaA
VFVAPTLVAAEVRQQYGVQAIREVPEVTARFYAVTVERRITHPATAAIAAAAREQLFG